MNTLIWDTESDNLLETATRLHSVQIGTVDGDDVDVYCDALPGYRPLREGLDRLSAADKLIGHNAIAHDYPLVEKLYPGTLRREQIVDTLVMARLFNPEERENSLRALGLRLGVRKGDFEGPWDVCTPEMMEYAAQDIPSTRAVYHLVKVVETWGTSCQLEHDVAHYMAAQERNGFGFDIEAATTLEAELRGEVAAMTLALRDVFPPIQVGETFTPKVNNKARGYIKGVPLTKWRTEHFNPASRKQVAKRLIGLGWKPTAFGANGEPTVDEAVLNTLPFPEAQRLVEFYTLLKRLGQLSDGDNGWLKMVKPDGRIHGRVNPNGACTGRMSHFKPNVAQADKHPRMRALWIPRPGWKLVGCDAEGLEARMLAHYLARYDGGAYATMVLEGNSDDRTDVHSANLRALVDHKLCPERAWTDHFKDCRARTKNLLYALMYGAGEFKLGSMMKLLLGDLGIKSVKTNKDLGKQVRTALASAMVGLDKLTYGVQEATKKRGYVVGLDGRHIPVRSEHSALNTLLQGGGAIVMKVALKLFMDSTIVHTDWPDMGLCANVHDEVQIECAPEVADCVGATFEDCIREAGVVLNVRCPLAGKATVGDDWSQTH